MKIVWMADVPDWAYDNRTRQILNRDNENIILYVCKCNGAKVNKKLIELAPDYIVTHHPKMMLYTEKLDNIVLVLDSIRSLKL